MHWKRVVMLGACTAALFACATRDTEAEKTDVVPPAVHIDGSNGVMPLVRALADAYVAEVPGAVVTFGEGLGSKARLDSLRAGHMDIALASHGLDTAALREEGLGVHRIAATPVVFGVHAASVTLADLPSARACDVLAGRETSWRPLGDGRDLPIVVVVRPEAEVDMEVLRDGIACARELAITPSARVVEETADMARALRETEGAMGVTTATVVAQSGGAIRALALDGVAPSPEAVREGRYPLTRSSYLVVRGDAHASVAWFLAFIASPSGQAVIEANGSVGMVR
ncbi:MAG: substrate-binding domain-containing protein [Gemmatimonadaceae bacterium]|jgi:phosphate transport system substrate-binding protein|nr:substrate-binding domain-containing protein [Gemmatimonadaceae bacterium]